MKIFVVQSHIGGGGAERVGVLIAGGLAQRGHEVSLVTNLHDEVKYPVDEHVKLLNMVKSPRNKLTKWVSAIKNLRGLVKQHQPDVIIGIMQLSSVISKLACVGTKIHVIMTEHYAFDRNPFGKFSMMEKGCKFYVNKIYSAVTVLTHVDKKIIGRQLKAVYVMPNPLAVKSTQANPPKQRLILAVGRLDGWYVKGFDVLIKAWAKVVSRKQVSSFKFQVSSEQEPGTTPTRVWRLQIAGTGSEESLEYLKALCKENGVEDSVDFLGFVSDMESLYKKASVFVLSSRYEGFGLVLIEAMSQGCACIACDYKGRQREIMCPDECERFQVPSSKFQVSSEQVSSNQVPSEQEPETLEPGTKEFGTPELGTPELGTPVLGTNTGILCPPEDVEALAAAMAKMIEDDEYRESVRGHAIERSGYYDIKNIARQWEELLNEVVK